MEAIGKVPKFFGGGGRGHSSSATNDAGQVGSSSEAKTLVVKACW
jgi:hypothetical protein